MAQRWSFMRLAAGMLLLLTALPSFAANARRLDLSPCESHFEAYRQGALAARQERLTKERSYATPRPDRIEKLEKDIAEAQNMSGADFFGALGGGMSPAHMHSFLQTLPLAEVQRRQKQEIAMLDALKAGDYRSYEVIKGARPNDPVEASYLQAMSWAHLCGWDARFAQLTGKTPPVRSGMTAAVNSTAPAGATAVLEKSARTDAAEHRRGSMSPQECEAKKQQVSAIKVPANASITASQETIMFMTKTVLDMIDGGCPGGSPEQRIAERRQRQEQYAAAEQACNTVQAGGRRCIARNHFGREAASQPAATGASECEDIRSDALAKMQKVNTSFVEPERHLAYRISSHPREAGVCRLAQHHARLAFDSEARHRQEYEDLQNDMNRRKWDNYASSLASKARALDLAIAHSAISKVEICSACGRAAVPSGTPSSASSGRDVYRHSPSVPNSDWETSPGIRK